MISFYLLILGEVPYNTKYESAYTSTVNQGVDLNNEIYDSHIVLSFTKIQTCL